MFADRGRGFNIQQTGFVVLQREEDRLFTGRVSAASVPLRQSRGTPTLNAGRIFHELSSNLQCFSAALPMPACTSHVWHGLGRSNSDQHIQTGHAATQASGGDCSGEDDFVGKEACDTVEQDPVRLYLFIVC